MKKLISRPSHSEKQSKPEVEKPRQKLVSFECGGTTFNVDAKYEYIKQIGHGAYGVVCSATNRKDNSKVAIKKVPNAFEDLIDAKRIVREIKLLSKNNKLIIFF